MRSLRSEIAREDLHFLNHYLQHSITTLAMTPRDAYARGVGLPSMAADNSGLLCTLLAIGAACMAIDTLKTDVRHASVDQIETLVAKGDHYHAAALQSLRSQLADGSSDLESAQAHSVITFGYAAARRRIFRLLHRRERRLGVPLTEATADLPSNFEWLHLLRGVQTIGRALKNKNTAASHPTSSVSSAPDTYTVAYIRQAVDAQRTILSEPKADCILPDLPRHPLTSWICSTMKPALQSIHVDLDEFYKRYQALNMTPADQLSRYSSNQAETEFEVLQSLAACRSGLSMLEALNSSIVSMLGQAGSSYTSPSSSSSSVSPPPSASPTQSEESPSVYHWRKAYLDPGPIFSPSEPFARGILTWPNRVADPFIVLLTLPLPFDHAGINSPASLPNLTSFNQEMQLIAWNIYAHWAALSVVIEDESWWWGDLGIADVANLESWLAPLTSKRDSGYFNVGSQQDGKEEWWPGMIRRAARMDSF
jgi:hypothetical protein